MHANKSPRSNSQKLSRRHSALLQLLRVFSRFLVPSAHEAAKGQYCTATTECEDQDLQVNLFFLSHERYFTCTIHAVVELLLSRVDAVSQCATPT